MQMSVTRIPALNSPVSRLKLWLSWMLHQIQESTDGSFGSVSEKQLWWHWRATAASGFKAMASSRLRGANLSNDKATA